MVRFHFASAGESHGEAVLAVLEGVPFGLTLDVEAVNALLRRRQAGFGRSARQQLERDVVSVVAGLYHGRTSGAPLVLRVANRDHSLESLPPVRRPRPGHADLAGAYKFKTRDARPVLERASARETAARVAAGAVALQVLALAGIRIDAFVTCIGAAEPAELRLGAGAGGAGGDDAALDRAVAARDASDVGTPDPDAGRRFVAAIREAGAAGDTLGGTIQVRARGVPPGLGSLEQWDRRLDARLGAALLSIPSAKAVAIGDGFEAARRRGSEAHDPIDPADADAEHPGGPALRAGAGARARLPYTRPSNRAGGLEGGLTNGEELVLNVALKPLSTLKTPLPSVDLERGVRSDPDPQRSDVCAVPAAAVVGEAMVALVLAAALLEAVPAETVEDLKEGLAARARRQREALERRSDGGTGAAITSRPDP